VPETVRIPARFNGPLESGNGGYSAGAIARFLPGSAEVSLRRPVPLDRDLEVVRTDADSLEVLDGADLIADARTVAQFDIEVPDPVTAEEARVASTRYRGSSEGQFSRCFVCGRARQDAFGVFAGEVEGRDVVASPWVPEPWTAGGDGNVLPEFVWAVLDCPTYFALYQRQAELPGSVLARLAARIDAPVKPGREHVVMAWPLVGDGRKRPAGAAVLSAEGETLAVAEALLIEPRA
jgi:hypothetical protein